MTPQPGWRCAWAVWNPWGREYRTCGGSNRTDGWAPDANPYAARLAIAAQQLPLLPLCPRHAHQLVDDLLHTIGTDLSDDLARHLDREQARAAQQFLDGKPMARRASRGSVVERAFARARAEGVASAEEAAAAAAFCEAADVAAAAVAAARAAAEDAELDRLRADAEAVAAARHRLAGLADQAHVERNRAAEARHHERTGFVYYVRSDRTGRVKIGTAVAVGLAERIESAARRSRGPVTLLALHHGHFRAERGVHRAWHHIRDSPTEWFVPDADLLAHIDSINAAQTSRRGAPLAVTVLAELATAEAEAEARREVARRTGAQRSDVEGTETPVTGSAGF